MTHQMDPLGHAGLRFFSTVSASISHEIKNSLAVINESAGYLEDVTLMARKGREVDINRLETIAAGMLKQVQRANAIVKNMNCLAHSLDAPASQVDLNALTELMIRLSERTTVTRGVRVTADFPDQPPTITTNPFLLENLIWLILDFAMTVTGDARRIELRPETTETGAMIRIAGLEKLTESALKDFHTEPVRLILSALNSSLRWDEGNTMIIINLPKSIIQPSGSPAGQLKNDHHVENNP